MRTLALITVLAVTLSGCFTSNGSRTPSGFKSTSLAQALLPIGSSSGAFSLTKVVRSNSSPNTDLDLVTSNHEIALFCPTASACTCRFSWTDSGGSFHEIDQIIDYVESNLARCHYTAVTPGTTFFDVKLVITSGGTSSHPMRVSMGSINPSLDPLLNSNYVQIQRYMCRDNIKKTQNSLFYSENSLLDPRLWSMGYGINFYTYSLGLDYGATTSSGSASTSGWECPPIPNDASFGPEFNLTLYSVDKIDLNNPLQTSVSTGDNTIYPNTDNQNLNSGVCVSGEEAGCEKYALNRHDYYLASFLDGVYSQPVCLNHKVANVAGASPAPLKCGYDATQGPVTLGSLALTVNDVGTDIVGFAAVPDSNQNCPSPTLIPAGKKWAKLWRFRTSLPTRTIQDVATPDDVGVLYCTTRKKECYPGQTAESTIDTDGDGNNNDSGVTSVCWNTPSASNNYSTGTASTNGTDYIGPIATVNGYGNCSSTGQIGDNFTPSSAPTNYGAISNSGGAGYLSCVLNNINCCLDNNQPSLTNTRRPANFTPGGNFCNFALTGAFNANSNGGLAKDNWIFGNGNKHACIESDTDAAGKYALSFPDPLGVYQLSPRPLEQNGMPDTVYVVTPTRVNVENMQNPNDPVGRQFTPIRYLPGASTPTVYGIDSGTTNNGNQNTVVYPLCVLQDSK